MAQHDHISDLTAAETARLHGRFPQRLREGAQAVNSAIGFAAADLKELDPASVEYALKVASLFTEGDFLFRHGWARLMPILESIRPPTQRGRPSKDGPAPPQHFAGLWPHQRLGHPTWRDFVEAPPRKTYSDDGATVIRGPGLGWAAEYERNLFNGWKRLKGLVEAAMPGATPEQHQLRIEEETEAIGGVKGVLLKLGHKADTSISFSCVDEAEEALRELRQAKIGLVMGIPKGMTIPDIAAQLRRRLTTADERQYLASLLLKPAGRTDKGEEI